MTLQYFTLCLTNFAAVFTCRMAALHQAALQGNVECVNLLLNNGAHPDIQDNKGKRSNFLLSGLDSM